MKNFDPPLAYDMQKLLASMEVRVRDWPLNINAAAWFGDNIRPVLGYIRSLESKVNAVESFPIKTFPQRESDEFDAGYALAVKEMRDILGTLTIYPLK